MDFRDVKEFIKDSLKYVITLFVVIIMVVYVVSLQQIIGPSMEPKYYSEDVVIVDKLLYKFVDIKRNDIISFSNNESKYLIKRIIGLPGEKIEYKDNYLYIDDVKYKETVINEDVVTNDFTLKEISGYDVIPNDMYLVLGDNRGDSKDSRQFGLISKDDIIGRIIIRVWPLKR